MMTTRSGKPINKQFVIDALSPEIVARFKRPIVDVDTKLENHAVLVRFTLQGGMTIDTEYLVNYTEDKPQ